MLPDFRVRQRDYLLEIARLLTQELDLEKLLARILRVSIEMLAGQAGLIALKQPEGWRVATVHGIAPAFLSYLTPLLAEEKVSELDVIELNRMLKELTYTASMGLLNGTGLPLAAHGQVIGVIFIFRNYPDLFTPNDRVLLQSFADQAAVAVFNAQLYGQVSYEKQRLDALLDTAADGILILNADHTIERCNTAFEKLYGEPRHQLARHIMRSSSGKKNPKAQPSKKPRWLAGRTRLMPHSMWKAISNVHCLPHFQWASLTRLCFLKMENFATSSSVCATLHTFARRMKSNPPSSQL